MTLEPNQRLLHYRLVEKIGEGGMGVVWKAVDTTLDREVAIKVLPAVVAGDPERLARFEREAKLLGSLNHPNIATVHGLHHDQQTHFLAMELVEGLDLAERIDRGAIPQDEAIEIAKQIAEGLEAAHASDVIHRDLKPANIKMGSEGKIKILDFGLAKALAGDAEGDSSTDVGMSPTLTSAGTVAGMILGTAGYMSPEQARGKPVDRRADLWAFGVVLFEMLTGERMFTGETVTDVIAAVVTREPEWDKLPADLSPAIRRVLRRCLAKDPRERLRDAGDARLELSDDAQEAAAPTTEATAPALSRRSLWLTGAACLILGVIATAIIFNATKPTPQPQPVTWSSIPAPEESPYVFRPLLELSPNGRHLAFSAPAPDGSATQMLWIRDLDSDSARPIGGTEGAQQPFWSPDSAFVGYFAERKLRKVSVAGGVPTVICDIGNDSRGGSWSADGTILFVPDWSFPVFRVADTGGTPQQVTELSPERMELSHRWPHFLPDGNHFLFYAVSTYPEMNPENPSEVDQSGLYVTSLDGMEPQLLHTARSRASYTDGKLLYVDDGILMARPFDPEGLTFLGEPVSLADGVTQSAGALWGGALFSVSDEGTLVLVRGASEERGVSELVWRDRSGAEIGRLGEPASYGDVRLSSDGRRLTYTIGDPGDVWITDLARETTTRFTFDQGNDATPVWSPDDDRIIFQSSRVISGQRFRPANLMTRLTSGLEGVEHLMSTEFLASPADWSPDGSTVMLVAMRPGTGIDLMLYSVEDGRIEDFLTTEYNEEYARFSPDGKWLAFQSDESGRLEVYVQPFPGPGGKWQVSKSGGRMAVWRRDGRELFYVGPDAELMAVPIDMEGGFSAGTPVKLFGVGANALEDSGYTFDVTPDGKRFLFLEPLDDEGDAGIAVTLVQGWQRLLD